MDAEGPLAEATANLAEDVERVVNDGPSETPSGSEPALRDGADGEDGGGAADRGVGGKDAAVKLALDTGDLGRSGTGNVPGETSVDCGEERKVSP